MEGWVGLVGWPIADALPTKWSHVNHGSGVELMELHVFIQTILIFFTSATPHFTCCNIRTPAHPHFTKGYQGLLRHTRSVAYSVELVLLNKHQISYLGCSPKYHNKAVFCKQSRVYVNEMYVKLTLQTIRTNFCKCLSTHQPWLFIHTITNFRSHPHRLKFHLARLDSTHSTCRAHAFWLCRASRTAQLDSLEISSDCRETARRYFLLRTL